MEQSRELEGTVALITGSARNIGRAIAETLAAQGARVVINARTSVKEAHDTAHRIEAAGGVAMVAMGDVTDPAQVEQIVASVVARWGRIDILVNNANTHGVKAFEDLTLEDWRRTVTVALEAPFLCMKACYPLMIRQGGGIIVNVGGSAGHTRAIRRKINTNYTARNTQQTFRPLPAPHTNTSIIRPTHQHISSR